MLKAHELSNSPGGYKEPFEQMDGNSCKLGVAPNVRGADVCTRVPQPESDPTLSCPQISAASFNSALYIKSCSAVTETSVAFCFPARMPSLECLLP